MSRKVVLVTGGARRLGASISESFAVRGYDVCIHHGHSANDAAELAAKLRERYGVGVEVVQENLLDADAPIRLLDAVERALGKLDVLVSSASVMEPVAFGNVTPEQWDRAQSVNAKTPFFLMQHAAGRMKDGGVIIQMSDHLAFETGFPNLIPHQVSKAAVTALIRNMAAALAPRVRVNGIAPGLVLAPEGMSEGSIERFLKDVPLGRAGSPDDVVHAIHFLVEAGYVTGEVLRLDGGRHLRRN